MRERVFSLPLLLLLFSAGPVSAGKVHFADLSRAANMGFADEVEGDGKGGWTDQGPRSDLSFFPKGERTFRGVPFRVLDPAKNGGRSVVVLKGRHRPSFPESAEIPLGNRKAAWMYFLHTCGWPGTDPRTPVARYEVRYKDGKIIEVPLRVGREITGWWEPEDTAECVVGWEAPYKNARVGVNLFPWKNPRPEIPLASVTFRSLGRTPLPILVALTLAEEELSLTPREGPTRATDTEGWRVLSAALRGPFQAFAEGPEGPPTPLRAEGEIFRDEKGNPVRLWGASVALSSLPGREEEIAAALASWGFNLVRMEAEGSLPVFREAEGPRLLERPLRDSLHAFARSCARHGLRLDFAFLRSATTGGGGEEELRSALLEFWTDGEEGEAPSFAKDPAVALASLPAWGSATFRKSLRREWREAGVTALLFSPESQSSDWTEAAASLGGVRPTSDGSVALPEKPYLLEPKASAPVALALRHAAGKPFLAIVEGWPWPAEGSLEAPLLIAAYGLFQGWDAVLVGRWDGVPFAEPLAFGAGAFRSGPAVAGFPVAALAFRRGNVAPAREVRQVPSPGKILFLPLAHGVRTGGALAGKVERGLVQEEMRKVISDTGEISWQGNVGLFRVRAPRLEAAGGFLAHRKVEGEFLEAEVHTPYAALAAVSLEESPLRRSRRILLCAAARQENAGQLWDASKFRLRRWGELPVLAEPVLALLRLTHRLGGPGWRARVLDFSGNPLREVPLRWEKEQSTLAWPQDAFYVELRWEAP